MKTTKHILKLGCIAWLITSVTIAYAATVTKISAGLGHSLFIESDNSLWGMGYNLHGELGDGSTNSTLLPKKLVASGVTAVGAGGFHSLFLKSDATLWGMGNNSFGQLGDGTTNDSWFPKQLATGVTQLAAGAAHTLFIKTDGSLWAMGGNELGQLGNGTTNNSFTPIKIVNSGVVDIAGGAYHSVFIKNDGSLWAMGSNDHGAYGDGTTNSSTVPKQIMASGVTAVSAGQADTFFAACGGSLWSSGLDDYGQLGDAGSKDRLIPAGLFPSGVGVLSAGISYHSLFTKSDGSLWGMGLNNYGQLGLGDDAVTNFSYSLPQLIERSNVVSVAAGSFFSLFTKSDGSLWGMGSNPTGALGDGSKEDSHIPEQIVPLVLVPNGGFERGNFSSWTTTGVFINNSDVVSAPQYVHSGDYGALVGPSGTLGYISQTIHTTPDSSYLVSFWLHCNGQTPNQFVMTWDAEQFVNQSNLPNIGWTNYQFVVTTTTTNTVLRFGFQSAVNFFGLDDVTVVPIALAPAPNLIGINPVGNNLVLQGANGLQGATYSTLTSTNLATPLNQWTPVATNVLNGSGNFSITLTNGISPNAAQRFYILQTR